MSKRPSISSTRSPGSNTPRSTSRSYSTRLQRLSWGIDPGMSQSSDPLHQPSMSPMGGTDFLEGLLGWLWLTVNRTAARHTREIRQSRWLDPMATRLHRPGLESESRNGCGVAVESVIRVAHQRIERLGIRTLHATEHILTLGHAQPLEGTRTIARDRRVDGLERARQQRPGLRRRVRDRQNMVERQGSALGKSFPRRHEGVEHGSQQRTLGAESVSCHERLRIMRSAT